MSTTNSVQPSQQRGPLRPTAGARARSCVGCQAREDMSATDGALVRLVLGPEGAVAVDAGSGGFGRGAYVHPRASCLAAAAARGLPRVAKSGVHLAGAAEAGRLSAATLAEAIVVAVDRRIEGLLISAARCRALALGADAAESAGQRGDAKLMIVARDAAAAAALGEVRRAVAQGRAVAWGSKLSLASAVGRVGQRQQGLGVVAVTSDRLAAALRAAVHLRAACRSAAEQVPASLAGRGRGTDVRGPAESAGDRS